VRLVGHLKRDNLHLKMAAWRDHDTAESTDTRRLFYLCQLRRYSGVTTLQIYFAPGRTTVHVTPTPTGKSPWFIPLHYNAVSILPSTADISIQRNRVTSVPQPTWNEVMLHVSNTLLPIHCSYLPVTQPVTRVSARHGSLVRHILGSILGTRDRLSCGLMFLCFQANPWIIPTSPPSTSLSCHLTPYWLNCWPRRYTHRTFRPLQVSTKRQKRFQNRGGETVMLRSSEMWRVLFGTPTWALSVGRPTVSII
jgi:hypothetical protein